MPETAGPRHESVGVIIGRFQVPTLTDGHIALMKHVGERHASVVVFLGCTPAPNKHNPLDYQLRSDLVTMNYPRNVDLMVMPLLDGPSNQEWSRRIDQTLKTLFPGKRCVLYAGRDSFAPHYTGKYDVALFRSPFESDTGTAARQKVKYDPQFTDDFRAGVIYHSENQFPRAIPCVDVAIINPTGPMVLMARKSTEENRDGWRFIGGFVDPSDRNLEATAQREVREETGVEVGNIVYRGSARIADWRYRNSPDAIITSFFTADYVFGAPKASDDITEVKWILLHDVLNRVLPVHRPLADILVGAYT